MKNDPPPQFEALFLRHPALCGFAVHSLDDLPDNCARSEAGYDLFVGDVGVSAALSEQQYREIFQAIVNAVAEVLTEQPEAGESLRGRTFARVLH